MRLSVCFSCCSSVVYQYLGAHPAHFGCRQTQRAHQSVTNINCYPSRFLHFSYIPTQPQGVCFFSRGEPVPNTWRCDNTPAPYSNIVAMLCHRFSLLSIFFSSPSSALEIVLEVPLGVCVVGGDTIYILRRQREKGSISVQVIFTL